MSLPGPRDASAASPEAPLDRAAIEAIVKELLQREPEIVYDALREHQARQQAAEQERIAAAVKDAQADLVSAPGMSVVANPNGDVTLVEFFDYRCGYCRRMLPALAELAKRDPNLRIVLRDFPILGPESLAAARAATAARKQKGAFWAFHQDLMNAQDLSEGAILAIAKSHGYDPEKLKADLADPSIDADLQANIQLGQRIGIQGTPAYIIGDELIPGAVGLEELQARIEAVRAKG